MSYEDLKLLEELRQQGTLTEEEFQQEKKKILDKSEKYQEVSKGYLVIMHLSQLINITFIGILAPIILWFIKKDIPKVDCHGKNIFNFMIGVFVYGFIVLIACTSILGIETDIIILILFVIYIILTIIAAVKAWKGEDWEYPFSIPVF